MPYKKLIVPNFLFSNEFGSINFQNVLILVEADSAITAHSFNQREDDHVISSGEIERLGRETARRFFSDQYSRIMRGEASLGSREVNAIRIFLGANNSELAVLLNMDKSSISRMLNGEIAPQGQTQFLLMERLRNELETPGTTKAILQRKKHASNSQIESLAIPAKSVAEWLIRRFIELEDCLTNLKLQKLLYYSQAVAVGRYQCRLLNDDFYAWEHGPVIKEIYHTYKTCGSGALFTTPDADLTCIATSKIALSILNDTMNMYGKLGAWVLRERSHSEPPWLETREKDVIEFSKIRDFFSETLI